MARALLALRRRMGRRPPWRRFSSGQQLQQGAGRQRPRRAEATSSGGDDGGRARTSNATAKHATAGTGVVDEAKNRPPWFPSTLSSLCSLDVTGEALGAAAEHAQAVLAIPEQWQPLGDVIDPARLDGLAARQLRAVEGAERGLLHGKVTAERKIFGAAGGATTTTIDADQEKPMMEAEAEKTEQDANVSAATLPVRVRRTVAAIQGRLLERSGEARLLLLGVLAAEHVLLLGPAGVGKSELGTRLADTLVRPFSQ
eukprot:COSAG01_NODE_12925_length_1653_cov_2.775432_1_plen_256_part_00